MPARKLKGSWWVDMRYEGRRYRKKSPVDTKRGADAYERQLRERLFAGLTLGGEDPAKEGMEVPTLKEFADEFMETYVKANNKPSEQIAKECILRTQLLPAFGAMRLDEIRLRDVEGFKARALQTVGAKRVNNCLTCLGKMLRYAQELEVIESVPRIKFVKVPPSEFDFLDFPELEQLLAAANDAEARAASFVQRKPGCGPVRYGRSNGRMST